MWSREDLKTRGKFAFQRNYWAAVAVSLITAIVLGQMVLERTSGKSWFGWRFSSNNYWDEFSISIPGISGHINTGDGFLAAVMGLIMTSIFGIVALLMKLFKILVGNVAKVGANRFFMENREHKTGIDTIFYGFRGRRYANVALTMFLVDLFTFLWSLLLFVPGIIKSYEYRMVPYILSENPDMHYSRVFEISRQMMNGQKMDTFILDLSFFGWYLLGGLTCNIVNIFYARPYYDATNAELYAVFRAHAFHTGQLSSADLPGYTA